MSAWLVFLNRKEEAMASINRAGDKSSPLPTTSESIELADLVQNTEREIQQSEQPQNQPETRKPSGSQGNQTQVTGRRAAVKVGGMAQQFALNSQFDAKKAGGQPPPKLSAGKDEATPLPADTTLKSADQEFDKELSNKLRTEQGKYADPKAAADLVKQAATDPKLFAQIVKEGSRETKQLFGNAILSNASLSNAQKAEMLQNLTKAGEEKGQASVTMDDIVKNGSPDAALGLGKILTDPKLIIASGKLMEGMQGSTIAKAIEDLHFMHPSVSPEAKAGMARQMLFHADKKDLEPLLSKLHNVGTFRDALTMENTGLFLKMSQNVGPKSMSNLVDIMANSHPSRANWVGQVVPGLNSPEHMNVTIDALQVAGKLDEFLNASYPKAFFEQLTPQNAGAVSAEYSRMAKLEKDPARAEEYRRHAMQADGMAENQFNKKDYEEYVRIRDHYHAS